MSWHLWYQGWPVFIKRGGPGSGHRGHKGRPGRHGGSAPGVGERGVTLGGALQYEPAAESVGQAEISAEAELEWATVRHAKGEVGTSKGVEIVTKKVEAQLKEDLTQPISIRRGERGASGVVRDGRFKTQFETGTSGGNFDQAARAQAEQKGLGVPDGIAVTERPVYGYFRTEGARVEVYGQYEFVLKDSVKERATYTLGDSLGNFITGRQIGGTRPSDQGSWDGEARSYLDGRTDRSKGGVHYIEAQIQGGVSLDDVAKVVIHSKARRSIFEPVSSLQNQLEAKGISVEYAEYTS